MKLYHHEHLKFGPVYIREELVSVLFCMYLTISCLAFGGCKKNSEQPPVADTLEHNLPLVKMDSINSISSNSVSVYGTLTALTETASERGAYWGTSPHPADHKTPANSYTSSGHFKVDISGLLPNTTYYIRGYVESSSGIAYSTDTSFTTLTLPPNRAQVYTDTSFAAGVSTAFVAGSVKDDGGSVLKETGICIGKNVNPDILGKKVSSAGTDDKNMFIRIDSLQEATAYYIRAYAMDENNNVVYGDNVKISTIVRGQMTYSLVNEDPNADAVTKAAYARIKAAFDKAVEYSNNFTSVRKVLQVNYSPGTPTAEGSISGWINIGPNPDYQKTGTALHEIAHTIGVGTTWFWGQLITNGVCQGANTNRMLDFMTHNPSALIYGDTQHFWPYGINGSWEDSGNDLDYIIHCLLIQAMKNDGLPSE